MSEMRRLMQAPGPASLVALVLGCALQQLEVDADAADVRAVRVVRSRLQRCQPARTPSSA